MLHLDAVAGSNLVSLGNEARRIGIAHVGEASTQLFVVLATQGVIGEEVDVVSDDHDIAHFEVGVHTTGSIRHEESLHAHSLEYTHGESNLFHVVTFVEVEATLHSQYLFAAQLTEDELAAVTFDSREGEVRNLLVGDFYLIGNLIGKVAESCTQYNTCFGTIAHHGLEVSSCLVNLVQHNSLF